MAKDKKANIDVEQIRDLMQAMDDHEMSVLSLKSETIELKLCKKDYKAPNYISAAPMQTSMMVDPSVKHQEKVILGGGAPKKEEAISTDDAATGECITSPMVGTFYRSPGPDDPPFIKEGDQITKDTVVCIIEAMKVMNEVKAGVSGKVKKILVEDGQAVEFGSKIISIDT
ncbi:MAG: acetyl-CoA carboxylase biotin carboxyl carrier protein [Chlamydiales bacterium]|nr:acetyl-CoA carboxylase biotin carboxyl carrier protein [Chlamydiales bacterium]